MKFPLCLASLASVGLASSLQAQCELDKLIHSGASAADRFGAAASVSGELGMIGAPNDTQFGVGGAGAAFFFRRGLCQLIQQQVLTASVPLPNAAFGSAMSMEGNRAVIGAPGDDGLVADAGAAYYFERIAGEWIEQAKLVAVDGVGNAGFGAHLAMKGTYLLVADEIGGAYVFEQMGADWIEVAKLEPDTGFESSFGDGVALDGDTAVVGAPHARGVVDNAGAAFVYERMGGSWPQTARVFAPDGKAAEEFGFAVAVLENTLLAGVPNAPNGGTAYTFERTGTAWAPDQKLANFNPDGNKDRFGAATVLFHSSALIGAPRDIAQINTFSLVPAGAAYLFLDGPGGWTLSAKLRGSDVEQDDDYGGVIAASPQRFLIAASGADDFGSNSGATYVYNRSACPSLCSESDRISLSLGGKQRLILNASPAHVGDVFWMLGSASGTSPGFDAYGQHYPLNLDAYFGITYAEPGLPPLEPGIGFLDNTGKGIAEFVLPAGLSPSLAGITLHHAYQLLGIGVTGVEPVFVSNATSVLLIE